jgi:argininosuccinate lyase
MFESMVFKPQKMRLAAAEGFLNATDCADYLVKKGMAFRDAYGIVGKLVRHCIDNRRILEDLSLQEYQEICPKFEADVYEILSLENCVNARDIPGGPAPKSVKIHIDKVRDFLKARDSR